MRKADTIRRLPVTGAERTHYVLPSWGYLEEIELRPRAELSNMDASRPYELIVTLRIAGCSEAIPVDVNIVARDVL